MKCSKKEGKETKESIRVFFGDFTLSRRGGWPIKYSGIRRSILASATKRGFESVVIDPKYIGFGGIAEFPAEIIVSGVGAISAVIGALLGYLAKRYTGKIIIVGKNGNRIEVPINTPKVDIDYFIEKSKELGAETIYLDTKLNKKK